MRVAKLEARWGLYWIRDGWRLLRKQPVGFITLTLSYVFALLFASLMMETIARALSAMLPFVSVGTLAEIGKILVAIFTPGLSVGFMEACRASAGGAMFYPQILIKPFRISRAVTRGLLTLGVIQVAALAAILLLVSGPDVDLSAATGTDGSIDLSKLPPEALHSLLLSNLVTPLATLPAAIVLWYAPVLVAWDGMTATKALFFSIAAFWRNRVAFAVYGLAWVSLWTVILTILGITLGAMQAGAVAIILIVPVAICLMAWMYCSFYPTYSSVFQVDPDPR